MKEEEKKQKAFTIKRIYKKGSHTASLRIKGVHLVGQEEDPELALGKFCPRFQDVGKQQGQSSVVIKPENVEFSLAMLFNYKSLLKTENLRVFISI
jgi:hypothetical protein